MKAQFYFNFILILVAMMFSQSAFAGKLIRDASIAKSAVKLIENRYSAYNKNPNLKKLIELFKTNHNERDVEFFQQKINRIKTLPTLIIKGNKIIVDSAIEIEVRGMIAGNILVNGYKIKGEFKTFEDRTKYTNRILQRKKSALIIERIFFPRAWAEGRVNDLNAQALLATAVTDDLKDLQAKELFRKGLEPAINFNSGKVESFGVQVTCSSENNLSNMPYSGTAKVTFLSRPESQKDYFDLELKINYGFTKELTTLFGRNEFSDLVSERKKSVKLAKQNQTPELLERMVTSLGNNYAVGKSESTKKSEPINVVYQTGFRFHEWYDKSVTLKDTELKRAKSNFSRSRLNSLLDGTPSGMSLLANAAVLCCASEHRNDCSQELNDILKVDAEGRMSGSEAGKVN